MRGGEGEGGRGRRGEKEWTGAGGARGSYVLFAEKTSVTYNKQMKSA